MRPNDLFGDHFVKPLVPASAPGDFQLQQSFVSPAEANLLLRSLTAQAAWQEERLQMFGRQIQSPRLVCWYGEPGVGYVYSGEPHQANGWLPELDALKQRLSVLLAVPFNFVLCNRYRNHSDSMGWHADNEPELGPQPVIASLSLGAERIFRVRPAKKTPGVRRRSEVIALTHGSLLVMRGDSQKDFQHSLPKSNRCCGARVNLTFRCVLPNYRRR